MSKYNGRDYLAVIWKNADNGARYEIGRLSKNDCYEFIYEKNNLDRAIANGFEPLVAFPNFEKTYKNDEVFPAFSSRLPDKRRKDINQILEKYDLNEYDAFELLRKSGGKLPTDSLEFIDPIFYDSNMDITREFYIAGTRHWDLCDPNSFPDCILNLELEKGEVLRVMQEEDNQFDSNAVVILKNTLNGKKIGYIPAYYAEAVSKAIINSQKVICIVKEIERENCQECVKVSLLIKKVTMNEQY